MNDFQNNPNPDDQPQKPDGSDGQFAQQVRHQQVSARVTEDVSRGVFSTGALVLQGNHEFVLDFIVALTRPHQVVERVILPPTIIPSMIRALKQNIDNYINRFGAFQELPKPPQNQKPPSVEEIYDQLKLPDEKLSGVYANTCMITHSPAEFVLDFITGFYPKSSVSARIFLTAAQIPRFHETLSRSFDQYQKKMAERQRLAQEQQGQPGFPNQPGQPGVDPNNPGQNFQMPPGTIDPQTPPPNPPHNDDDNPPSGPTSN